MSTNGWAHFSLNHYLHIIEESTGEELIENLKYLV